MAGNKRVELDINGYMENTENNISQSSRFKNELNEPITNSRQVVIEQEPVEEKKVIMGRPPRNYSMKRKNTKQVYFDDDTNEKLNSIKFFEKIDNKDFIYAATRFFLKEHFDGKYLDRFAKEYISEILEEMYRQ